MSFTRRAARVEIILLKMFSYTVGEHRPEMAVLASLHVNLVAMYYCIFRFTYIHSLYHTYVVFESIDVCVGFV